jgi:hypothetical protein
MTNSAAKSMHAAKMLKEISTRHYFPMRDYSVIANSDELGLRGK